MIGIKIKNSYWEKALLDLLKEKAEIYQRNKEYSILLTNTKEQLHFLNIESRHGNFKLSLPLKKSNLESLLGKIPYSYQNSSFFWDSISRQLKNKKTNKKIQLTEKEAALINFLSNCKQNEATKSELLKKVWQYKEGIDTHTVETTIYSLRQKLKQDADKLIIPTSKGYRLV